MAKVSLPSNISMHIVENTSNMRRNYNIETHRGWCHIDSSVLNPTAQHDDPTKQQKQDSDTDV